MTVNSAYFFAGSKSAGLIRMPSIVAPSWLFQEITSRVASVKSFTCVVMFVRTRGENPSSLLTNTSFNAVGELEVKAIVRPSEVSVKQEAIRLWGEVTRVTFADAGSTRNRCDAVF